jgi:hypothetical protein
MSSHNKIATASSTLALMLAGALLVVATAEANAQQRIPGFQRPNYGYGTLYGGPYSPRNRVNPDRDYFGPNVLHGPP